MTYWGGLKAVTLQLEWHLAMGGVGVREVLVLGVWLKCQRTRGLPFKTSWHFHQGQALLSVSVWSAGKLGHGSSLSHKNKHRCN